MGRPRELHISVESQTGERVRVEFRDNGPGITDVEKIFEPFVTSKEKGLGVGLSICRSIVDAHEGCLRARVSAGWTIFELSLPLYKRNVSSICPAQETLPRGAPVADNMQYG
jgi:signal transduction histidine kinase